MPAQGNRPPAEEIVLFAKDPRTKIATITFDRADALNAPTVAARQRFNELVHQANIDDEVKVLVIRGEGKHLGSGADLEENAHIFGDDADAGSGPLNEFKIEDDGSVKYPPRDSYRFMANLTNLYADGQMGCRSLQNFKKISIVECKGYVYGWHFYIATDADLVVSSEEALFGHAAFRYIGWAPRMWAWCETMGLRKFMEMVFTGRPFTAQQMYECNFINSVVTRDKLEDETMKYALACSRTRPTDTVVAQKAFFEIYKQHRGEYMGSVLTGLLESMQGMMTNDSGSGIGLDPDTLAKGLANSVKENDAHFPADWRLSYGGRAKP